MQSQICCGNFCPTSCEPERVAKATVRQAILLNFDMSVFRTAGLKIVWAVLYEFETRNIPQRKIPAAKSRPPRTVLVPMGFQWGKILFHGEMWDSCPSAHRCCFCPLASLPRRHRRCFTFSHSRTVEFGGCSPPHLMWEMYRRARGLWIHRGAGGGGIGTRPWWLALLACGGA